MFSFYNFCQFFEIGFLNLIFTNSSISLRNNVFVEIKKESIWKLVNEIVGLYRAPITCSHFGWWYQNLMSPILIANHASRITSDLIVMTCTRVSDAGHTFVNKIIISSTCNLDKVTLTRMQMPFCKITEIPCKRHLRCDRIQGVTELMSQNLQAY